MGGRGYAAQREKGGLLSGRVLCWGLCAEWEGAVLLSVRAGLCCWAVERWTAEWEGAMLLGGREVDC